MRIEEITHFFKNLLVLFTVLFFISACGDSEEERLKSEWVKNEVQNLIAEYRNSKIKECRNDILKEVEAEVDSLLSNQDLFNDIIDENIPTKPIKPVFVPLDSIALQNHKINPNIKDNQQHN